MIGLPSVTSLVRLDPLRMMLSRCVKNAAGSGNPCVIRDRSEFVALNDGVHDSQSVMLTVGVVSDSDGIVVEIRPPNVSWRLPPRLTRVGPNAVAKLAFELIDESAEYGLVCVRRVAVAFVAYWMFALNEVFWEKLCWCCQLMLVLFP